ncbi:MAG TPA: O-antigen polymerase [Candidatus Limnocylindrales bacterium]|nr:O-antigen polymerase [Candidatus Limnocylindrales bacterium]
MTWLAAAIFPLVVVVALLARRMGGSWYAPAAFFGAYWCVFGGLPLLASPIGIQPVGMLFVAGACGALLLGAWLAHRLVPNFAITNAPPDEPPYLGWAIGACTVLGLMVVAIILYSVETGSNAVRILSLDAIVQTIHRLAVARNGGTWSEPAVARVLTTATYLGPMLSGVMLGMRTAGRARWLSLVSLAPSVMITVILTTRSSLLLPIALGASAYLATTVATGRAPSLTWRRVAWLAAGVAVVAIGFVLIQMARYAGWSSGRPSAVVQSLWLSVFPYLGVFSLWLQNDGVSASLHPTFGQYTFAGFFDLLHIHTRVAGLYTDQVVIDGSQYNIYTAFRGVVQDFTIPGALLFFALAGFGAELAYQRVRSGDAALIGVLAAFYAATLWSFVVDVFIYNTIVLAFVLLIGYLAIAARLASSRQRVTGSGEERVFAAKVAAAGPGAAGVPNPHGVEIGPGR